MRRPAALVVVLLLASCGDGPKAPEKGRAASTEPDARSEPGTTEISSEAQRNAGIQVVPVIVRVVGQPIRANGQLEVNADRTWSVGAHVEGRVVEVFGNPGDYMRRGAVLAHIHGHDVHESRADLRRAQSELERAQAATAHARRVRDRAVRLLQLKAGSKQEVEAAEGQLRDAEAAVAAARTELDRVRVHLSEYLNVPMRDPGAKSTPHDDEVPVKAPESGMILERKVSAGTVVTAGEEMFRITDTAALWMIANAAESDLAALRIGQPVIVTVRAYPDREFRGRIVRLGERLDPETRTLQVRVLVPNGGGMLKPEMFATAAVGSGRSQNGIFVPEEAVQDLNGASVVFLSNGAGRFQVRPVQLGQRSGGAVEVISGLQAGDNVVSKGSFVVKSHLLRSTLQEEE
ncbi:MAG TPA: efflux RND transporter periplasmic adaptor subunit [Bryobacteraceae bacterium]|nr:efflux RND transporter periplasmic adaptor subunit [Bryobacteraceae bacterium]